ncbi:MAG: enoyl-CoA hydratase/isomerase family protein [Leptospiraceae bacterium]|nr:enoyl-CoA hydratase/isomerase family protein [Leptospiraceae bacterium]
MALVDLEFETINDKEIAFLYLNNPQTKNSMTWDMSLEFKKQIDNLKNSSKKPECLILSGKNHIFSSGGDLALLKSFKDKSLEENKNTMFEFYNNFLCIQDLPFPTVAAVNGHAMGAAFSLSLACDLRVFAIHAKYSLNFVKLGIHPGMGASFLVKELFGKDMANYLLMLGEPIDGEEAFRLKISHDSVQLEEVKKRAVEIAINLTESGPLSLSLLKETLNDREALKKALLREAETQAKCFQTKDFEESLKAIEEKRKPNFSGN